jgi:hypothetical protein
LLSQVVVIATPQAEVWLSREVDVATLQAVIMLLLVVGLVIAQRAITLSQGEVKIITLLMMEVLLEAVVVIIQLDTLL